MQEGSSDQSSNRQHRFTTQMKNHYATNNGTTAALESGDSQSKMVSKHSNLQAKGKVTASWIFCYSQIMNLYRKIDH